MRLNFDLKLFNQAQSLLGTHYCSSFLFFPKPHILIPQFSHMIWLVFSFFCLQLFLTPMPRPGIELMAELHQTGTFEGRSTNRATWPRHYSSSFLRWAIPGVFFFIFFIFVFSVFFVQLVDKILPMTGFKPQISGVGSEPPPLSSYTAVVNNPIHARRK